METIAALIGFAAIVFFVYMIFHISSDRKDR